MQINHNIAALNTQNQLQQNNEATQSSLEKLSSGLKINKAGDDAAGLAISEKMRGQICGLDMEEKNAQDGISLVPTAESAMKESHAILQRMRELSVQAANDSNTQSDRQELQKEVDQLTNALNDISEDTEFNGKNLLDGTFAENGGEALTFQVGANEGQNLKVNIGDMSANSLNVGETNASIELESNSNSLSKGEYEVVDFGSTVDVSEEGASDPSNKITSGSISSYGNNATTTTEVDSGIDLADGIYTVKDGSSLENVESGNSGLVNDQGDVVATSSDQGKTWNSSADGSEVLSTGKKMTQNDEITVASEGLDISSQESADKAISTIQGAIDQVSSQRADLGAVQNRLDHTINNLSTSSENMTAAESRIRDTDMDSEMMEFTKNNILSQASQGMLAQAQQRPQGVLQLLQ